MRRMRLILTCSLGMALMVPLSAFGDDETGGRPPKVASGLAAAVTPLKSSVAPALQPPQVKAINNRLSTIASETLGSKARPANDSVTSTKLSASPSASTSATSPTASLTESAHSLGANPKSANAGDHFLAKPTKATQPQP